jgi:sporulation-control protein spo0M
MISSDFCTAVLLKRCNALGFIGAFEIVPSAKNYKTNSHILKIIFELEEDAVLFKTTYQE